jgi:cytochrome c
MTVTVVLPLLKISKPMTHRFIHRAGRKLGFVSLAMAMAISLAASLPALADQALADKSACLNCHAMEKKLVGPSFKDIAAKYKGKADAVAVLKEKIEKGSSGAWGSSPMPGMGYLPKPDIETLAVWISKMS